MRETLSPFNSATKFQNVIHLMLLPQIIYVYHKRPLFSTSTAIATVVLTGLVIIPTQALGQVLATFSIKFFTIPALMLNNLNDPFILRATPAEVVQHQRFLKRGWIFPYKPCIFTAVGIWPISRSTGVTGAISYNDNSEPE